MKKPDAGKPETNRQEALERVMSPGRLVLKRFMRNRLAILGIYILLALFLFSYVGPFFIGYGQYETFYQSEGAVVRAGPGLDQERLSGLKYDDTVHVLGRAHDTSGGLWYQVQHLGANGYVSADSMRLLEEAEQQQHFANATPPPVFTPEPKRTYAPIAPSTTKRKLGRATPSPTPVPTPTPTPEQTPTPAPTPTPTPYPESFRFEAMDTWGRVTARSEPLTSADNKGLSGTLLLVRGPMSKAHPLGTDAYAFDVLVRLMYGGRVSLIIGFVAVLMEMVIGVTLGGISGYYGRWVDNMLMRLVDIINCVPTLPVQMILGAILLQQQVPQEQKIYWLMLVLGILGWPGIARLVRGQILSLREQEFMIAAEATGLRVSHRIVKHLLPNVMPQLIVTATMGIGGTILSEAALSFLGLGVPYPLASWGNMVNAVNDRVILERFWNIWVPPGLMILLAVLAFNFVGDGLRDAFDPKMKR